MKHIRKRISKIVDELVACLFSAGATDINVNIKETSDYFKIAIESNYSENHKQKVDKLIKSISSSRQEEIEEYYWELTGESDVGTELFLVGTMIDKAETKIDGNKIEIELYRNK